MQNAKINGININYVVEGQGEPLVLIQGYSATLAMSMPQVKALKKHFRVIGFDNRGVGKSDKSKGPYTTSMLADDTIGLMDYLGVKKAHILGTSIGGMIAQDMAIRFPERVMKLILVSTCACNDNGMNGFSPEVLSLRDLDVRKGTSRLYDLAFNRFFTRLIFLPLLRMQLRRMKESETIGLACQKDLGFSHSMLNKVSQIRASTLVIVGTKDRVIKPSSSEILAKSIPNAKLEKIENGSHILSAERKQLFYKIVLKFLKST